MTLKLLPNVEALVSAFLRAHPDVAATEGGNRVYTVIPKSPVYPLLRVTQYDDQPVSSRPLHLTGAFLQIDAFGGSKIQAWRLGETARAALAADLTGSHDDGVVPGVDVRGLSDAPDDSFSPAKPRYRFDAVVWVHPLRGIPAS